MNKQNPSIVTTLQIIHRAIFTGIVLFAVVAYLLNRSGNTSHPMQALTNILHWAMPLFLLGGIAIGTFLFNNRISRLTNDTSLTEKLNAYRSAFILRIAIIDGTILFSIVAYMLTGSQYLFYMIVIAIAVFAMFRPTADHIANTLSLSEQEQTDL